MFNYYIYDFKFAIIRYLINKYIFSKYKYSINIHLYLFTVYINYVMISVLLSKKSKKFSILK